MIQPKPAKMTIISANSVVIWPKTIMGPAINPFFTESEIVTVNIGPGTTAPDKPTQNDDITNKIVSIN